ncbi:hypothetical protein DSM112329_02492 [Paraconexibacter sp. AEG42_29]|uniref:Mce/MlaD domain-containing protein n=1 Tax=Paraconexibacter sp. AEG42_29 TaxID=2997339 RepID=A0AAU7AVY5_9ACTN
MRPGRRGMSNVTVGALVLAVAALATYLAFTKRNPFADRFEVKLAFSETMQLQKGSPVRVAGIDIGTVRRVESVPGSGRASLVTIEIEEGAGLHTDATFKARPRIFLEGNEFIDVKPGSASAPALKDGTTIADGQTSAPVGLADVLTLFERDGRASLQQIFDEYGRALEKGGAEGFNRSIRWWTPAYRDGAVIADATIGEQPGDLRRYLSSSAKAAAALSRDPAALQGLVRDFATTASAIGSEQNALADAIGELPGTLNVGRRALRSLDTAFPPLRKLVRELRPAVRASGPSLDAQLPFVRELRQAVRPQELGGLARDLRAAAPDLVTLTEDGVKLQTQSRLLSSCQLSVLGPWQRDRVPGPFPSTGRVFEEGVKWLPGIAGESRNFDAHGQYIRSQINGVNIAYPIGDRLLLSATPLKANPPKSAQPLFHPETPCETQERPDLRSNPQDLENAIPISQSTPAAQARAARTLERAMPQLRRLVGRPAKGGR